MIEDKQRVMTKVAETIRYQYAALPFAVGEDGEFKVLLVTSRGKRDWIIPKGWPIPNLSAGASAAREAYEEAGVIGTVVSEEPIGFYRYAKRDSSRKIVIHEVAVFLLAVERQLRKWPEKSERETRWLSLAEAPSLVTKHGLADVLQSATSILLTLPRVDALA